MEFHLICWHQLDVFQINIGQSDHLWIKQSNSHKMLSSETWWNKHQDAKRSKQHAMVEAYRKQSKFTEFIITEQRLHRSGYFWRSHNEVIQKVNLWEPAHGEISNGSPLHTYVDYQVNDTYFEKRKNCQLQWKIRSKWKR